MVDRLNRPHFAGSPSFVQSMKAAGTAGNVTFAGVTTINSGSSSVAVTGVDIGSESVVFLGAQFTTNAASGFGRPFAVTSITVATPTNSGAAGFVISTVDSLGASTTTRVPYMVWRVQ